VCSLQLEPCECANGGTKQVPAQLHKINQKLEVLLVEDTPTPPT